MKFENKHIQNLHPYKVASHKIWDVTSEEREKIFKLDWNEATIPPSPNVLTRIQSLIAESSFFQYYPSTYNRILHDKLSDYVSLPKENIQYFKENFKYLMLDKFIFEKDYTRWNRIGRKLNKIVQEHLWNPNLKTSKQRILLLNLDSKK